MPKYTKLILLLSFSANLLNYQPALAKGSHRKRNKTEDTKINLAYGTAGLLTGGFLTYIVTRSQGNNTEVNGLKNQLTQKNQEIAILKQNNANNGNQNPLTYRKPGLRSWPQVPEDIDNCDKAEDYKYIVDAGTNQYQQGGPAACLHIAATFVLEYLKNPTKSLYDQNTLVNICQNGSQMLRGNQADEFNDIFTKYKNHYKFKFSPIGEVGTQTKRNLTQVITANMWLAIDGLTGELTPSASPLNEQGLFEKELQLGFALGLSAALLKVGPEAWGLIIHEDFTFTIGDSHGKQDENQHANAYERHFKYPQYLFQYADKVSKPLRDAANANNNQNQLLAASIYIYWISGLEA